jgi:Zn-dependent protease/predicted transcriptional regulator
MFGRRITLFRLFGFEVHVDASWLILAFLVMWSLAAGVFPLYYPFLPRGTYWWMGAAGALGLFLSIVLHEMTHSLVARRYGLPMKGITLFVFGGVAEMNEEPQSPRAEFVMAAAGPVSSLVVAAALYGVNATLLRLNWPVAVTGVLGYLAFLNIVLAACNLLPAFPLDWGRMLRAALWGWRNNVRSATRTASRVGEGFAWGLVALGIWRFLTGNLIGGMWMTLIGLFLRNAAETGYRQVLLRDALKGEKVSRLMSRNPVTVPPGITLEGFVEDYVYRHDFKMFPVVDGGSVLGWVRTRDVKETPRRDWEVRTVRDVMQPCGGGNAVGPDADAMEAFGLMTRTGNSRLLVMEGDRLAGILALKDILRFFSAKMDIETEEEIRRAA